MNVKSLTIVLAGPALAGLVFAGCGGSSHQATSTTAAPSTTQASTTTTHGSNGSSGNSGGSSGSSGSSGSTGSSGNSGGGDTSAYLTAMKTQPHFVGLSDSALTRLGRGVCSDFKGGSSFNAVASDAIDAKNKINSNDTKNGNPAVLTDHDAGFLVGAAVKTLCPQYSSKLPTGNSGNTGNS